MSDLSINSSPQSSLQLARGIHELKMTKEYIWVTRTHTGRGVKRRDHKLAQGMGQGDGPGKRLLKTNIIY